ncbi:hypothetical protein DFQ27_007067 [Actinomortierella ambigua]|uniref:Uncharacterized protein n=1 Tax=Actinomortierella ambigua TaxID=1343610 RepID=A0A9P6PWN3_9FUNG|nr:hypothetical protein DFQ27_007067 [Actinomortierella ambigua]
MVCHDTDTNETVASSARSVSSDSSSTRTRSSKSSRQEVTPGWVAAIDPLSMSTKAVGPGFLPSFNTHLYSPGFQAPAESVLGGSAASVKSSSAASVKSGSSRESSSSSMHARDLPLSFQQKQLVFKDVRKAGSKKDDKKADSVSLTGSTKTSSTKGSRPSEKDSIPPSPAPPAAAPARPATAAHTQTFDIFNLSSGAFLTPTSSSRQAVTKAAKPGSKSTATTTSSSKTKVAANSARRPSAAPSTSTTISLAPSKSSQQQQQQKQQHQHQQQALETPKPVPQAQQQSQPTSTSHSQTPQPPPSTTHLQHDEKPSTTTETPFTTTTTTSITIQTSGPSDTLGLPSSPPVTSFHFPSPASTYMSQGPFMTAPPGISPLFPSPSEAVSNLATKRSTTWRYLQRVHQGGMAMYNTAILTEAELRTAFTEEKMHRRTLQYFLLGTSLATILEIPNTLDCVKALNTMLQEYEYFTASESRSKMSFFKASSRKATDGKSFEETGEYSHLEVRNIPFNMDYVITFATLCEMIALVYEKLGTESQWNVTNADMVQKADVRLKKILTLALKEVEALTREVVVQELNAIDLGASGIPDEWEA